jgi:pimeloyl-ACP methyl ester carboxylesterase
MSSACPIVPFRERAVEVSGIRLRVRERGDGDPLRLINGIGAHIDMGASMEHALPQSRLIAFDAPGTGRSGTAFLPLGLESLAQLSERLLDRLDYDRVDVLGYSFGGLIAQYLAHRAPERIRRWS